MAESIVASSGSKVSRALGAAVVALGFLALFPPGILQGLYSTLEASLLLLVLALVTMRSVAWSPGVFPPTAVALLLFLMTASALWSSGSWASLRDALAYAVLAAVAALVVSTAGLRAVVLGIVLGGMIVLVASALLLAVAPPAAFYFETGAVQGVFTNRNAFGYVMLQTLPAALALRASRPLSVILKAIVVVSILVAIVASDSQTSIVGAAVVAVVWVFVLWARAWPPMRVIAPAGLLLSVIVVLFNGRLILESLGKDVSLSGRTPLWEALVELIPRSPLVGFGWSQSWPESSPHSIAVAEALDGTVLFHAHNELLNWAITLGAIGVVLILAVYGQAVAGALLLVREQGGAELLWPLLALTALLARGLTEISETNPQGWFVLMLALFATTSTLFGRTPDGFRRLAFLPRVPIAGAGSKGPMKE